MGRRALQCTILPDINVKPHSFPSPYKSKENCTLCSFKASTKTKWCRWFSAARRSWSQLPLLKWCRFRFSLVKHILVTFQSIYLCICYVIPQRSSFLLCDFPISLSLCAFGNEASNYRRTVFEACEIVSNSGPRAQTALFRIQNFKASPSVFSISIVYSYFPPPLLLKSSAAVMLMQHILWGFIPTQNRINKSDRADVELSVYSAECPVPRRRWLRLRGLSFNCLFFLGFVWELAPVFIYMLAFYGHDRGASEWLNPQKIFHFPHSSHLSTGITEPH